MTRPQLVVPTMLLFIETLVDQNLISEHYKLKHRVLNVKKVCAELLKLEMDNIRYAARILSGERGDLDV